MYAVYILKSIKIPDKIYIGLTQDLERRLKEHNRGDSSYTSAYKPWEIETYIVFSNKKLAENFEKYLKSGSGYAFLKKRLIPKLPK
ncbi:MAG: GIY-YIG nuclease family protein [Elusimicrobiota bacterium]|jgi:predicted GIY-YIG superfamily endonuclease